MTPQGKPAVEQWTHGGFLNFHTQVYWVLCEPPSSHRGCCPFVHTCAVCTAMEQIILAAVCLHIHATRLIVQQELRTGTAVAACLVMLQIDSQMFTQSIQLVIGEIWKAAPSHLAGTRIRYRVSPNNSVCMETFGQHAHIKRCIVCNQHPTFKKAPELRPYIRKSRCIHHCGRCNSG